MSLTDFLVDFSQPGNQFFVQPQFLLATGLLAVPQLDAAFDFAARGVGGYGFAQCPFEVAQVFRHFELDVEIAVIDRAQFDIQAFAAMFGAAVGKTGHAFDHNFLL